MPRKIILILIIAVVLAASGAAFWQFGNHGESGNNKLTLYGNVDIRQVQLAFNGSDRIATMQVREGEPVKKGQLLATLDESYRQEQCGKAENILKNKFKILKNIFTMPVDRKLKNKMSFTDII